ncbi:hypothetical protein BC830DRAFT_1224099 [Chytriomyces sp. MP71]|nr:hypothetical protein BC830DRAFT_1224099 [Chytriomyces sp. MP71]
MFSKIPFLSETPLNTWIGEEKDRSKATRTLAKQTGSVAKAVAAWGKPEAEDLKFISEKLSVLHSRVETLYSWLADQQEGSRAHLKILQKKCDALTALKKRQRELQTKLDAKPGTAKADALRAELNATDRELMTAHAELEGDKREVFQRCARMEWDALVEFAGRVLVVASFGNHIADQVPQGKLAPGYDLPAFKNASTITQIMSDFASQEPQWRSYIPADLNCSHLDLATAPVARTASGSLESLETIPAKPVRRPGAAAVAAGEDAIYTAALHDDDAAGVPARGGDLVAPNAFKTSGSLEDVAGLYVARVPTELAHPRGNVFADAEEQMEGATDLEGVFDASPVYAAVPVGTLQPPTAAAAVYGVPGIQRATARPLSSLAAAVREAVAGPLGAVPGREDKKAAGMGGTGSVGDGVSEMLRQTAAVPAVATLQQEGAAKERRMSSLARTLREAEAGMDEKKGVGVVGRMGSVGDGVTELLRGIAPVQTTPVVPQRPAPVESQFGALGTFVIMFQYDATPGKADEMSIVPGDLVAARNVYEDGWGFGRLLRTNALGFFPFNAAYPVLSSAGTPFTRELAPRSVAGVEVSPAPSALLAEGVIGSEDFNVISAAAKSYSASRRLEARVMKMTASTAPNMLNPRDGERDHPPHQLSPHPQPRQLGRPLFSTLGDLVYEANCDQKHDFIEICHCVHDCHNHFDHFTTIPLPQSFQVSTTTGPFAGWQACGSASSASQDYPIGSAVSDTKSTAK